MKKMTLCALAGAALSVTVSHTAHAAPIAGPHSVSAFYSDDDQYLHAIVGQSNGDVREVYYVTNSFHQNSVIAHFDSPVAALGSYYTKADRMRHVIVALQNQDVWEVYFNPQAGITKQKIMRMPYGVPYSISAWVDPSGLGWFSLAINQTGVPGWYDDEAFVYWMSGHVPVNAYVAQQESQSLARPIPDIAGVGGSVQWPANQMIYAEQSYPGNWELATDAWAAGSSFDFSKVKFEGNSYPYGNLPVSMSAVNVFTSSYQPVTEVLEIDSVNQLVEMTAGGVSYPATVAWSFTYGPTAQSVGAVVDPARAKKHAVVMMSNGDLWDMFSAEAYGSPWSFYSLGTY